MKKGMMPVKSVLRITRLGLLLGLLGVLLLSSCRPKKKHQLELYTSSDGGFSILLPGKPELSTKNQMTVFGNQTVHYIKWKLGSMDIYKLRVIEISYMNCGRQFTYDSLHLNRSLDTAVKTRLRDFTERAVHIENVDYNGYPGRSFIYDMANDNSTAVVKEFIANGRKYDVTIVASNNQATANEVADIFNSFKIIR